jgi:hypothetical protein
MDNLITILIATIAISVIGIVLIWFLNLEKGRRIEIVKNWLLLAVIQAEKELGSGTVQVKLRFVYDMFIQRFNLLSHMITFDTFSLLVDEALDTMKDMIQNNKNVADYINEERQ